MKRIYISIIKKLRFGRFWFLKKINKTTGENVATDRREDEQLLKTN